MIKVVDANKNKETFYNLVSLYGYEASMYVEEIGKTISEQGIFHIPGIERFVEEDSEAYVVFDDDHAIGFVCFTNNNDQWMMDEIFVTKTYRKQEVINQILDACLSNKEGVFQTHILKGQQDVCELVERYFPNIKKEELDPIAWLYTTTL